MTKRFRRIRLDSAGTRQHSSGDSRTKTSRLSWQLDAQNESQGIPKRPQKQPKVITRRPKNDPRWGKTLPKSVHGGEKAWHGVLKVQNGSQRDPRWAPKEAKSTQRDPKGGPKTAQGKSMALKRLWMACWSSKISAKGSQGEAQRRPKASKGSQKTARRPPRRMPKSSKISWKINEKIGFVFYWFFIRFWQFFEAKIKLKLIEIQTEWELPAESQYLKKPCKNHEKSMILQFSEAWR